MIHPLDMLDDIKAQIQTRQLSELLQILDMPDIVVIEVEIL